MDTGCTRKRNGLIIMLTAMVLILALVTALSMSHIICIFHEYSQPDCVSPAVCIYCGREGEPALGHDYADATALSPATCRRCGATIGGPLPSDSTDETGGDGTSAAETPAPTPSPAKIDYVSEARAQGITVADHVGTGERAGAYCTFYSTDNDNGVNMKSTPEDGLKTKIGKISLPFNGYLIGSDGSWYLVRDCSGSYFYIYSPIVGVLEIDSSVDANDYSAILSLARAQGIAIPDGFIVTSASAGEMCNYSSTIYAVYKYADPTKTSDEDKIGTFRFYNDSNPDTYSYDGSVIVYGHYGKYGLCEHDGEFFWAKTGYFIKD